MTTGAEHGASLPALSPEEEGTAQEEEQESDAFRMYQYKVKPCCKVRPHDWCSCVYSHPGEKAKRRNPLTFTYSGTACPEYRRNGCCKRGDACPFAHGVFECWLHPTRYRTQMCSDGVNCKRRICFFAHTESELRKPEDDPLWLQQQLQVELGTENPGALAQLEPVQQGNLDTLLNAQLTELQQQQQQQQQEDAAFGERIREVIRQFASQGKGLTQSQMMQVLQVLAEQQQQQEQQQRPPVARVHSLQQGRASLPSHSLLSQAQTLQQHLGPAKGVTGQQLAGCQAEPLGGYHPVPAASRTHSDPQVHLPDSWTSAPPTPTQQQVQQQQQHQQVPQQQQQLPQLPQLPEELRASLLAQQLQALQIAQQGLQASHQNSESASAACARSSQSAPGNQFIPMPRPSMKLLAMQQQLQSPSLSTPTGSLQQPCPVSPTPGATSMRARGSSVDPSVPPAKVADLASQMLVLQEGMQQQQQQQQVAGGRLSLGGQSRPLFPHEGDPTPAQVQSAPDRALLLSPSPTTVSHSPPAHASSQVSRSDAPLAAPGCEALLGGPSSWDTADIVGAKGSPPQQHPLTGTGFTPMGFEDQGCSSSSQDARVAPPPPPQFSHSMPASPVLEQQQRRRQPVQQRLLLMRPPAVAPPQQMQAPHPTAVPQVPHSPGDPPLHVLPYMGDPGFVSALPQYPPTPDRWGLLKGGDADRGGNMPGGPDLCSYEHLSRQGSADMGQVPVSGELGRMFSFERSGSNLAPRQAPWLQTMLPGLDEVCHQSTGSQSVSSDPAILSMNTGINHDSNASQLSSLSNYLSSGPSAHGHLQSGYLAASSSFRTSPAYSTHTSSSGTRSLDPITQMDAFHGRSSMPAALAAPVQALSEGPFGVTEGAAGMWEAKRPSKHPLARTQTLSHHLSMHGSRGAGGAQTPHLRRQVASASDDGCFLGIPSRPGPDSGLSDEAGQKAHAAVSALLAQVTRRQQQQQQQQQPQPAASSNPCP